MSDAAEWIIGSGKKRKPNTTRPQPAPGMGIAPIVDWMEEAAAAAGTIAEDVQKVSAAAVALLESGLTNAALVALLQAQMGNERNGRPMPAATIMRVLHACRDLNKMVQK